MAIPSEPQTARAHVWVSGRVQGVAYRAHTQQMAIARGVSGWVRNLPDRRVEAVFEGNRDVVELAIAWCHQGSPAAIVDDVEVVFESSEGLAGFDIRY